MNGDVPTTLERLLEEVGPVLLDQPRRLEAFLRDLHPRDPREVAVLVEALDLGIVARLRAAPGATFAAADIEAMAAELVEAAGLANRFALWAVESWIDVLGHRRTLRSQKPRPRSSFASVVADRPGTLEAVLGEDRHTRG